MHAAFTTLDQRIRMIANEYNDKRIKYHWPAACCYPYQAKSPPLTFHFTCMSNLSNFPVLSTRHFLLRQIIPTDVAEIFRGLSNPEVTAWYGVSYDMPDATQEQMKWYRDIVEQESGIWWAISHRENPTGLLGTCGFYDRNKENQNTDLGYWLHPEWWGKAILQECLPAILAYAFAHLDIYRVEAEVEPANIGSSRLLRKLGFSFEGTRRQCERRGEHFVDLEYYSMLKDELG
ncbi:GNAT family protein [soil metagenome]